MKVSVAYARTIFLIDWSVRHCPNTLFYLKSFAAIKRSFFMFCTGREESAGLSHVPEKMVKQRRPFQSSQLKIDIPEEIISLKENHDNSLRELFSRVPLTPLSPMEMPLAVASQKVNLLWHALAAFVPLLLRRDALSTSCERLFLSSSRGDESNSDTKCHACIFPAALAFADISGFTALTAALSEEGSVGIERLTRSMNSFFSQIIDTVSMYDGDVIKFAGDALIIAFPVSPVEATSCSPNAVSNSDGDSEDRIEKSIKMATLRAAICGKKLADCFGNMRIDPSTGRLEPVHQNSACAPVAFPERKSSDDTFSSERMEGSKGRFKNSDKTEDEISPVESSAIRKSYVLQEVLSYGSSLLHRASGNKSTTASGPIGITNQKTTLPPVLGNSDPAEWILDAAVDNASSDFESTGQRGDDSDRERNFSHDGCYDFPSIKNVTSIHLSNQRTTSRKDLEFDSHIKRIRSAINKRTLVGLGNSFCAFGRPVRPPSLLETLSRCTHKENRSAERCLSVDQREHICLNGCISFENRHDGACCCSVEESILTIAEAQQRLHSSITLTLKKIVCPSSDVPLRALDRAYGETMELDTRFSSATSQKSSSWFRLRRPSPNAERAIDAADSSKSDISSNQGLKRHLTSNSESMENMLSLKVILSAGLLCGYRAGGILEPAPDGSVGAPRWEFFVGDALLCNDLKSEEREYVGTDCSVMDCSIAMEKEQNPPSWRDVGPLAQLTAVEGIAVPGKVVVSKEAARLLEGLICLTKEGFLENINETQEVASMKGVMLTASKNAPRFDDEKERLEALSDLGRIDAYQVRENKTKDT